MADILTLAGAAEVGVTQVFSRSWVDKLDMGICQKTGAFVWVCCSMFMYVLVNYPSSIIQFSDIQFWPIPTQLAYIVRWIYHDLTRYCNVNGKDDSTTQHIGIWGTPFQPVCFVVYSHGSKTTVVHLWMGRFLRSCEATHCSSCLQQITRLPKMV